MPASSYSSSIKMRKLSCQIATTTLQALPKIPLIRTTVAGKSQFGRLNQSDHDKKKKKERREKVDLQFNDLHFPSRNNNNQPVFSSSCGKKGDWCVGGNSKLPFLVSRSGKKTSHANQLSSFLPFWELLIAAPWIYKRTLSCYGG